MDKFLNFLKDFGIALKNLFIKIVLFIWDIILRIVFSFRDLGVGIWHGIKAIGRKIVNFHKRFVKSSVFTKIGHFIMGFGNFARKQFVKGAIFLAIQVLFVVFMVTSPSVNGTPLGAKAIPNFFTLGGEVGMPISEMGTVANQFDAIVEFDDLDGENYKSELSQIIRNSDVIAAIKNEEITAIENDNRTNEDGSFVYDPSVYTQVIYDNRYGTNDYYGYASYEAGSSIRLKSGTSILWIASEEEITNFDDFYTSDADLTVGVYENKDNQEGVYVYFVIISFTGFRDRNIVFADDGRFANADFSRITYDTRYVNSDIDNSFLMMLFGIATFAVIALYLVAYTVSISSSYKTDVDVLEGRKPTTFIEDCKTLLDGRFHLTLLTPALILILVFTIIPTLLMILISFTDMQNNAAISGQILVNWNGLENFINLFTGGVDNPISKEIGKNFFPVLTWTFEWAIIATFSCYFGGIFLALLINRKDVKCKKLWRTIFILTIAIPQFITLLIMRNLLIDSGPINSMLLNLGIIDKPIDFLGIASSADGAKNEVVWTARATVLVINLYIGVPYTMLMTSGILMNIPSDLYEAATIDGANKWQMFRKITLPYVIFVTTPYLISSFIGNITSFNTIFLTTGGGPTIKGSGNIAGKTDLLVTWLYKLTIDEYRYNSGSIIGILTFIITAFITLVCYRNSKAYKEEDTFQ